MLNTKSSGARHSKPCCGASRGDRQTKLGGLRVHSAVPQGGVMAHRPLARVLRAAPASAQLVAAASRARAHARGSATCAGGHRAGAWEGALGRHPLAGVACGGVVVHRAAACAAAFSTNRLRTENHCSRTANRPTGFARALSCLRTQQCPARPKRAQDLAASLPSTAPPHLHGITHTAVCARTSACYV